MKNLFFLAVFFVSSLVAECQQKQCTKSNECCEPVECCIPCDFAKPSMCPPEMPAFNAPYGIDVECPWNMFVTVSYLYWEAKEEGLAVGTTSPNAYSLTGIETISDLEMNFESNSAFKIGLGVDLDHDNWELLAGYTYYRNCSSASDQFTFGDGFHISNGWFPFWQGAFNSDVYLINTFSGSWDLDVDLLDIDLSRKYFVGECLTVRTMAGLRAAWIRQKYTYLGERTNSTFTTSANHETKSWGVGPTVGVNTDWMFCGDFRFFFNALAGVIYTDYSTLKADFSIGGEGLGGFERSVYNQSSNPCYLRPQAELSIGLGWGSHFCDKTTYFDLEIGYSANIYWNQNMFVYFTSEVPGGFPIPSTTDRYGDLSLHGLTISARLKF